MGKLYDFSFSDQEEEAIMRFQKFLEEHDPDKPEEALKGDFNVLKKMNQVNSPFFRSNRPLIHNWWVLKVTVSRRLRGHAV